MAYEITSAKEFNEKINQSDNRLSISKMQMFFVTIIIVGAYFACFIYYGFPTEMKIPTNLLVLMGFSMGSFVGAKMIAKSNSGTNTSSPGRTNCWRKYKCWKPCWKKAAFRI